VRQALVLRATALGRRWFKNTWVERHPVMLWLYQRLCRFGFRDGGEVQFLLLGETYAAPASDLSMVPSLMNQTYETLELEYMLAHLRPGMVVYDVGANIGLYSKLAARAVGPTGEVHAFEPSLRVLDYLRRNVVGLPQVRIVTKGVGAAPGKAILYVPAQNLGCSSALAKQGEPLEIELTSLDAYRRTLASRRAVNFIKMDIEGFEPEALAGMGELLRERPIVMMEFNPSFLQANGQYPEQILRDLQRQFGVVRYFDERSGHLRALGELQDLRGQVIANLVLNHPEAAS